jgi:hypothetical protein
MTTAYHLRLKQLAIMGAVATAMMFGGCSDDAVQPAADTNSSFALLQAKVINTSCAISGCHVTGAPSALESGLVLQPQVAYANIVNIDPKNADALADGMKRVKPGSPDSSFFLRKLQVDQFHHTNRNYGNAMPLGRAALSVGQVEFIRQWIAAGAPMTGEVADRALLDDTTSQVIGEYTTLPVPDAGKGYQISIGRFPVKPDFERELFLYRKLPNPQKIYVTGYEVRMRPGSHHFVMYTLANETPSNIMPRPGVIRDIRREDNTLDEDKMQPMAYHIFLGGSVSTNFRYNFPPGVGLELPANAGIDMNSHYFNKGTDTVWGEVSANLYTADVSQIAHVAKVLNLANMDFELPPGKDTTIISNYTMTKPTKITMLTSHSHKFTKNFKIRIFGGLRDGEIVYETSDWLHAPFINFPVPIELNPGEGLTSEVTYYNSTGRTIGFGLTSEDEMNIVFGYYYNN